MEEARRNEGGLNTLIRVVVLVSQQRRREDVCGGIPGRVRRNASRASGMRKKSR